ncbi:isopenicillin N synthase family oxygenase [Acinetobacter sp. S40]|uniref:isopenicillin N synthase family dioxygenase n=1 Tax=unclassified Acinetobacter TaxID=196816 RepID=UPI00190ABAB1|nr:MULTISPECIES: isopenicillin N synthase family oxygenase [unclassified Acinetobacter]MBJ9985991.1 isopenicillin N synthase family oxygenase [Acinetobacter sp. S40]MBK0064495.1 isopenicillin N synthase family oxygenase [Acinetobacter sp. S55]MBK0067193.1 isopenicillin N synthase family oxygenase [Acinetobacter sp. S54]
MRVSIPVIDVSGLFSSDLQDRQAVAQQMKQACQDKGFFYISNHGISTALQQVVFEQSRQFFDLSMDEKEKVHKKNSIANRGYEPLKNQTLEAGTPADLKEGFYAGREYALDSQAVLAKRFNHGPNQWPEQFPEFANTMQHYQAELEVLAKYLMRGLALSLSLAENYFDDFCQDALVTLRLLHYPPQPANPEPNEKGCGAHTDFGALTLLLQDQQGGLQVWDKNSESWIDAPPIEGTYVINLGDLIARWTNNHFKSTLHRVINKSGKQRYSVPFFFGGNPDYQVECLPNCKTEKEPALFAPTTVEQHHIEMYRRTYG